MDRKMTKELIISLPNGGSLRCGEGEHHVWGGYVSICDSSGIDLLYWDKAEFEEDAESVIGAIFAAALQPIDTLKSRTNNSTTSEVETSDNQVIKIEISVRVSENTNLRQLKQQVADALRTISNPLRTDQGITVVSDVKITI